VFKNFKKYIIEKDKVSCGFNKSKYKYEKFFAKAKTKTYPYFFELYLGQKSYVRKNNISIEDDYNSQISLQRRQQIELLYKFKLSCLFKTNFSKQKSSIILVNSKMQSKFFIKQENIYDIFIFKKR